jgi:hypothetical protein
MPVKKLCAEIDVKAVLVPAFSATEYFIVSFGQNCHKLLARQKGSFLGSL